MNRFFAEMKRELAEMKKYKFNLIFANISLLILFYSLLKKFKLGNGAVLFFMFVCWYFATHGLSNSTYILEDEIMDRTIVSIVQSDKSVLSVLYSRNLLQIMLDLIKATPLFCFCYIYGGNRNKKRLSI